MNGLVIYKGKYGATAQYAQWLGQMFDLDVVSTKECTSDARLRETDYFLIGTSVYFNTSLISKFLNDKKEMLKGKKISCLCALQCPKHTDAIVKNF